MVDYDLKKRYQIFLHTFQRELDRMFNEQKEFIMCKEGCSYCCEKGEYPFSELEFNYLLDEYKTLDNETKFKILENVARVNEAKSKFNGEQFMYDCPFLVNHRCSVYKNRGLICRTFGLLVEHDDDRLTMPFCQDLGLNYSKVYDNEIGQIVIEKDGNPLCETMPKAYRIAREHVLKLSIAKNLDIDWGASKTLIDMINESNMAEL